MKPWVLLFTSLCLFMDFPAASQEKTPERPFLQKGQPVPGTVIQSTRAFRERLLSDPYRPAFHFCVPEDQGHPGDPNGAFFYKGRYHLMYLYNRTGSGFSWGHVSSQDLLHWRHHPDALGPGNGDEGAFSGGGFVDDDGKAYLTYWMLWGARGIGMAENRVDDFSEFEKFSNNPVIPSDEWGITYMKDEAGNDYYIGSADPSNIWKKGDTYYMVAGNLLVLRKYGSRGKGLPANMPDDPPLPEDSLDYQGDRLYLFASDDLKNWEYQHEFYEGDRNWTSKTEDNMCPVFLPLSTGKDGGAFSGKHLLLFISHNRGCQYYVGEYRNDRFYPDNHGRMTWNDNAYFAPEALVDDKGRQIMWAWMFDDRPDSLKNHMGWTGTFGLPRSLWLGEDGTLRMAPVTELKQLRMNAQERNHVEIAPGKEVVVHESGPSLLELNVTVDRVEEGEFGVSVCMSEDRQEETVISYDPAEKLLKMDTRKSGMLFGRKIVEEAPLELQEGEPLELTIYVDKSVVEVFANNRQAIARRVYPSKGGTGVALFSKGENSRTASLRYWEIMPSNPY